MKRQGTGNATSRLPTAAAAVLACATAACAGQERESGRQQGLDSVQVVRIAIAALREAVPKDEPTDDVYVFRYARDTTGYYVELVPKDTRQLGGGGGVHIGLDGTVRRVVLGQ